MRNKYTVFITLVILLFTLAACQTDDQKLDAALHQIIQANELTPIEPAPVVSADKLKLGQLLFFDKELSGNRDASCATCHQPLANTVDGIPLPIGTGGTGTAPQRHLGPLKPLVARNTPALFDLGQPEWRTMFWDSRVEQLQDGTLIARTSQGPVELPPDLENVVAVQALFPPSARAEMRGFKGDPMRESPGDVDIFGNENEIAKFLDNDILSIWGGLWQRITAIPDYVELLQKAYPNTPIENMGPQHLVNAIAAFQIDAYTLTQSPWDKYLSGDKSALSSQVKRGALLFYGKAQCNVCHLGNLLTDQKMHNIAAPQIGPGKQPAIEHRDYGRSLITRQDADIFGFRTPPLRNVSLTGPYLHNGAYDNLEAVIRHHLNPGAALQTYDVMHLPPEVRQRTWISNGVNQAMLARLDPLLPTKVELDDAEIKDLIAFLEALTDPAAKDLSKTIPKHVPSGLPVSDDQAAMQDFLQHTPYVHHP
jgi:cytochrome c peroxidase